MSSQTLKAWMDRNGWNEVDIASACQISPDTVRRYLKGRPAHRSTVAAFERLVKGTQQVTAGRIAVG